MTVTITPNNPGDVEVSLGYASRVYVPHTAHWTCECGKAHGLDLEDIDFNDLHEGDGPSIALYCEDCGGDVELELELHTFASVVRDAAPRTWSECSPMARAEVVAACTKARSRAAEDLHTMHRYSYGTGIAVESDREDAWLAASRTLQGDGVVAWTSLDALRRQIVLVELDDAANRLDNSNSRRWRARGWNAIADERDAAVEAYRAAVVYLEGLCEATP